MYAYAAAGGVLLALLLAVVWLVRRGKREAVDRAQEKAARIDSEAARKEEKEIRGAAEEIRRGPGPRIPDL